MDVHTKFTITIDDRSRVQVKKPPQDRSAAGVFTAVLSCE